jgi:UDP-glucose 4-epimerase
VKIFVTGGAGYIGSHTANRLLQLGFDVVVFDNLTTGFRNAVPKKAKFIEGDVRDTKLLIHLLQSENIQAIIHFAAKLNVKESTFKPQEYFDNNAGGVDSVVNAMKVTGVKHIVFSSTAALFGDGVQDRAIREEDPIQPLNPYGESKKVGEEILKKASDAKTLTYCALRYFNVAGAAEDGSNGQRTADAFHLIHLGVQAAVGKIMSLQIFGVDYPTPDGTCIRDYIHVEDLADIHILALKYLLSGKPSESFNCGYGKGYSVKEVIETLKKVSGADFSVMHADRRPGDASCLIADSTKLRKYLGWNPKLDSLEKICLSAYHWEKQLMTQGKPK